MYRLLKGMISCYLILSLNLWAESVSQNKIHIVYHIATLNHWESIAQEQVDKLIQFGLAEACESLTVTVVGNEIENVYTLFRSFPFSEKIEVIHAGQNLHLYEFPGIEKVQEIAQRDPESNILYLHTKGVLHSGQSTEQNVRLWRQYMEFFLLEQWRECVTALQNVDICGVDLAQLPSGRYFFSGNFWWAKGNYLQTCQLQRESRYDCEEFIGRGVDPRIKTFHQSGKNPRLMNLFTFQNSPQFFHGWPQQCFESVMNLYNFGYLPEYYRN